MYQINLAKRSFYITSVTGFLQNAVRIEIFRFQMIRIMSFIRLARNTCYDRILRIPLIWSPYIFGSSHRHAVIVSGSAFRTHNIIITISLCKMRCFDTSSICTAAPDSFRISDYCLFFRRILNQTDHTRFFISFSCLPLQRNNPFSSVIVVKNRSIKSCGM